MPAPAVKPATPPKGMVDRSEGWGMFGRVQGYPDYRDDGEWPVHVERNGQFALWPTETSDGEWSHQTD